MRMKKTGMRKTGMNKTNAAKMAPAMAACQGLGLCIVMTLAICTVSAALIVKGVLPQQSDGIAGSIAAAVSAFGGAYLTAKQAKAQKLVCSLVMCAVYALVLLVGNLLFVEGSPGGALRVALPVLAAGVLAALAGSRKRTKRPVRKK